MSRAKALEDFLTATGWQNAEHNPLRSDASSRSYTRILKNGAPAILMDAPLDTCGSITPFLKIDQTLRDRGLAAPEIYASDETTGFIVMEDFGDALLARVCEETPEKRDTLYLRSVDVLVHLVQLACKCSKD